MGLGEPAAVMGEDLAAGSYKALIETSRRRTVLLMERFDAERVTLRPPPAAETAQALLRPRGSAGRVGIVIARVRDATCRSV